MRVPRLYVDAPLAEGARLALDPKAAGHVVRALRLGTGDELLLFDGNGAEYRAVLADSTGREISADVRELVRQEPEPAFALTLGQALARGDKMDWIVQKATELGATAIVPLATERSEVRLDPRRASKRLAHWQSIAASACEQCGRARLPRLAPVTTLAEWCAALASEPAPGLRLALYPDAAESLTSIAAPAQPTRLALAIGPEGGFGERDLEQLAGAGFRKVSLGPRVLRTETAGLAALAAVQTLHGDF